MLVSKHHVARNVVALNLTAIVLGFFVAWHPDAAYAQVEEAVDSGNDQVVQVESAASEGETPLLVGVAAPEGEQSAQIEAAAQQNVTYDYNAGLYSPTGDAADAMAGVYATKVNANDGKATEQNPETIGMPSIADANLADEPTTESPAIIQGAAVGYEEKTGPTEYAQIKPRDTPYDEFMYSVLEEKGQDGTVHKKLSGFDGTYVIVRTDVSGLFEGHDPETSYLHVKQDDNRALLVAVGMTEHTFVGTLTTVPEGVTAYKAGSVYKTGSYKLADMFDKKGSDTSTPYLDVVVFATAANVAGADAGKADALNGDIPLHFYVDDKATYNDVKYDPASTDPNHIIQCLQKFYDSAAAAAGKVSNYLVKGSDLALETMVENSSSDGAATTYWSLQKSLEKPYYDQEIDKSPDDPNCGRTVKLMSEVAIPGNITLAGTDADNLKKRTLDVNSFDVQIAKNSSSETTGFTLDHAWLKLQDKSKTTGAEFAIGNNAKMVINNGGKLIIDETCQLEIEWDGATTTGGQTPDILNNGILDLNAGGEVVNNGVITIEGTEGKPYQPGVTPPAEKGFGEFTVEPGATLTNNGTLLVYGRLINLGTIENNGKYDDVIVSNDPDKGMFSYHRGIQVSWKDDITQPNVTMGELVNGQSKSGETFASALLRNLGDILLAPGKLLNYGTLLNASGAHIFVAASEEAIIPIEPTPEAPTVVSKRITVDPPKPSIIENYGTIINDGCIVPASVEILDNTGFGKLSVPGNHPELFQLINHGTIINNSGCIWGWGSPYTALAGGAVPTGDPTAIWIILALAAVNAASVIVIVMAARRTRKQH